MWSKTRAVATSKNPNIDSYRVRIWPKIANISAKYRASWSLSFGIGFRAIASDFAGGGGGAGRGTEVSGLGRICVSVSVYKDRIPSGRAPNIAICRTRSAGGNSGGKGRDSRGRAGLTRGGKRPLTHRLNGLGGAWSFNGKHPGWGSTGNTRVGHHR